MRRSREGQGSIYPPPPEKSQKYRVSLQYWSGSREQSQSYLARIQCRATIGMSAELHLNVVLLAG